jgi:predicted RNA-binding protein YlqC (UPF0109 family)
MMDEALEHLVKGIVDNPDDVVVAEKSGRRGTTLEVRVNPEDIGKVIGRNGRTAKALRTVGKCARRTHSPRRSHRDRRSSLTMRLLVGQLVALTEYFGEATIEVRTDEPDRRFAIGATVQTDTHGDLKIISGRVHNGILLLGFDGITDRNGIEKPAKHDVVRRCRY